MSYPSRVVCEGCRREVHPVELVQLWIGIWRCLRCIENGRRQEASER